MKSLAEFKKGERVKILSVKCGRNFSHRISELGLFVGSEIEVVKNDNFCPIIIKIFSSQIALGQGEAQKIYGEEI